MKRYTAAQARERLAEVLDSAERGVPVVIERRGVRFRLDAVRPARRSGKRLPLIESLDPALESGQWSWSWEAGVLGFSARRKRR